MAHTMHIKMCESFADKPDIQSDPSMYDRVTKAKFTLEYGKVGRPVHTVMHHRHRKGVGFVGNPQQPCGTILDQECASTQKRVVHLFSSWLINHTQVGRSPNRQTDHYSKFVVA